MQAIVAVAVVPNRMFELRFLSWERHQSIGFVYAVTVAKASALRLGRFGFGRKVWVFGAY
jgi:hypothetical protein